MDDLLGGSNERRSEGVEKAVPPQQKSENYAGQELELSVSAQEDANSWEAWNEVLLEHICNSGAESCIEKHFSSKSSFFNCYQVLWHCLSFANVSGTRPRVLGFPTTLDALYKRSRFAGQEVLNLVNFQF